QSIVALSWGVLLFYLSGGDSTYEEAGHSMLLRADSLDAVDFLDKMALTVTQEWRAVIGRGVGLWGMEACRYSCLSTPPALLTGPSPRRHTPPTPAQAGGFPQPPPGVAVSSALLMEVVSSMICVFYRGLPGVGVGVEVGGGGRGGVGEQGRRRLVGSGRCGLEDLGNLADVTAEAYRVQPDLSSYLWQTWDWRGLQGRCHDGDATGPGSEDAETAWGRAGGVLLDVALDLFPMSIAPLARLLGAMVHDEKSAARANALLVYYGRSDLEEEEGGGGRAGRFATRLPPEGHGVWRRVAAPHELGDHGARAGAGAGGGGDWV
ncbi:unnamed protein product, partial [Discosporangium mesarthrocarpum]